MPSESSAGTTPEPGDGTITHWIRRSQHGDAEARERLAIWLHRELHALARRNMAAQPEGHTLQATALLNEVWLKVAATDDSRFADRAHFLNVAAHAMRQVLVDHARGKLRDKRGGGAKRVALDGIAAAAELRSGDLVALDDALERLQTFNAEMSRAVELRFFGGASVAEAADALGLSKRTFERKWTAARAWLAAELGEDQE